MPILCREAGRVALIWVNRPRGLRFL